jgi:hypothetical protein
VASPDLTAWPKLIQLAECLCSQIATDGLPEPCECLVLPGAQVALDYCEPCRDDKCGMAWVRLTTMYPSANFPNLDETLRGSCRAPLAYGIELGVARCAPVGKDDGMPPDPADQQAAVRLQMSDALAMRKALSCCYGASGWMLGVYTPFGPEGGCVGGSWQASVSEL